VRVTTSPDPSIRVSTPAATTRGRPASRTSGSRRALAKTGLAWLALALTVLAPPAAAADDPSQETSARFDVTSDVLSEPGTYVLGAGVSLQSQRTLRQRRSGVIDRQRQYVSSLQAFGLYSVSQGLDVFSSLAGEDSETQSGIGTTNGSTASSSSFPQWRLGARYQLIEEGRSPGVRLLVNTVAVRETVDDDTESFTDARAELQIHRNSDPVNLRLRLRYDYTGTRQTDSGAGTSDFDPADRTTVSTAADFVVNDRVVFIGGIGLTHADDATLDDIAIETTRWRTPIELGMRYGFTPVTNIETRIRLTPQTETTALELTVSRNF